MFSICFVVFMVFQQGKTQDVCSQYDPLPNARLRYYNYRVNKVIVYDSSLIPGWYRAEDEIMPTEKPPSSYICGTQFPIWMNGTHPTLAEGIVDRIACAIGIGSFCSTSYSIKVRNCMTYSVYFLINTRTSNEAYCFGIGERGEEPNFVPLKPVVYPLEVTKSDWVTKDNYSHVHFVCKFEPSKDVLDDNLYYQVIWYTVKNNVQKMYIMPEKPNKNLSDLELTEDIFRKEMKQTLGVEISCTVLPLSGPKGTPGTQSERSDAFWAGIRVDVKKSTIVRGDETKRGLVTVTSTIPLGCSGMQGCELRIKAMVPDESKCEGPSFQDACGAVILSDKWNYSHDIVIQAADSAEYSLPVIFTVHLKTVPFWTTVRIWDDYSLSDFQVEIFEPPKKDWTGKVCSSTNDPHMRTFDGRSFENHIIGEYILYRHLHFRVEVQIKTTSCDGHIQCNCGVAVMAGQDVFVVDMCGNNNFCNYKNGLCLDSALDVRKNDFTYKVYLPYGTYVTVTLQPASKLLNVYITSSVHDQGGKSTGLCGALTDNCTDDFRMRNGSLPAHGVNLPCNSLWSIQPDTILNEWRVRPDESLFDPTDKIIDKLLPWEKYVCVCGNTSDTSIVPTVRCGGHTTEECRSGAKVSARACKIINERRRRSVPPNDRFPTTKDRKRRSTVNQMEENIHMTQEEALNYCRDYMNRSQIYNLCQNVPSAHSETNVETCAHDIILTNTTVWSDSARESMREQCLNEISRNNTFREVEENSGIVQEIQEKACPLMCSNKGSCVKGICVCESGYGANDCSLNLHEPPEIFGLLDDGLCDERHVQCDHAFVYGKIFAEGENLTCRITPFTLSYEGDRNDEKAVYVPAEHETLFEVVCPVQRTQRKKRSLVKNTKARDRFVIGYTISVSNDGQNYGKDFDLYMYNSECQLPENTSSTFSFVLQDGYCFINQNCVVRGTVYEKDECLVCDDKQSEFEWSTVENDAACRNVPETSPSTLIPKGSSPKIKLNIALLFVSIIAFGITFTGY